MTELFFATLVLVMTATVFAVVFRSSVPPSIWSPVYTVPSVYLALGTVGYLYYNFASGYINGFYDIGASQTEISQGYAGFLVATSAFLIGVMGYLMATHRSQRRLLVKLQTIKNYKPFANISHTGRVPRSSNILISLIPILILIVGVGPTNILYRTQYLVSEFRFVVIAGSLLALPASFYLGFLAPRRENGWWAALCIAAFLLYFIIFLSLSTRRVAVVILFFIMGLALGGARRQLVAGLLLVFTLLLPTLLHVPLMLRSMPSQGMLALPYNFAKMSGLFSVQQYLSDLISLVRNLTFGVPLAGYVKNAHPISQQALVISLNPLPSFVPLPGLESWNEIKQSLRLSVHIPYSAIGDLLNHGYGWLILYYVVVGIIAAWIDRWTRLLDGRRSRLGFIAAASFFILFAIISTQYNLRSATRIVYYSVLIAISWRFVCRIRLT